MLGDQTAYLNGQVTLNPVPHIRQEPFGLGFLPIFSAMMSLTSGGMGVIGAETTRKFVKEGHKPVVFARHRDDSLVGDILDKIDFEQGDVLDMPRILQAIKRHKVTHVVHSAAFVGAVSAANPALSIQVNVMGLVNVLEAARARMLG